jgi:hypothetical protein
MKVQQNKNRLELKGTHQLLVYTDEDNSGNLLGMNINIIKKKTKLY